MKNMSNKVMYYIGGLFSATATIFLIGTVLQAFMLEVGFTESQVYLYNALTQGIQVGIILLSTFFLDKIKNAKIITVLQNLSYAFISIVLLIISNNRGSSPFNNILFFSSSTIFYIFYGLGVVNAFRLPYQIMDMNEYGKIESIKLAITGGGGFIISLLFSFAISKFDYFKVVNITFSICILLSVISAFFILKMKFKTGKLYKVFIDKMQSLQQ